jgi:hypothetical protein
MTYVNTVDKVSDCTKVYSTIYGLKLCTIVGIKQMKITVSVKICLVNKNKHHILRDWFNKYVLYIDDDDDDFIDPSLV